MKAAAVAMLLLLVPLAAGGGPSIEITGKDCRAWGTVAPVDSAQLRPHVPAEFQLAEEGLGRARLAMVFLSCADVIVGQTSTGPMDYFVFYAEIASHGGGGFDLIEVSNSQAWYQSMLTVDKASRLGDVAIGFDVVAGQHVRAEAHATFDGSWVASTLTVGASPSLAVPAESFHWGQGKHGNVYGHHKNAFSEGGSGLATVTVAPGSFAAQLLGAQSFTGPAIYGVYTSKATFSTHPAAFLHPKTREAIVDYDGCDAFGGEVRADAKVVDPYVPDQFTMTGEAEGSVALGVIFVTCREGVVNGTPVLPHDYFLIFVKIDDPAREFDLLEVTDGPEWKSAMDHVGKPSHLADEMVVTFERVAGQVVAAQASLSYEGGTITGVADVAVGAPTMGAHSPSNHWADGKYGIVRSVHDNTIDHFGPALMTFTTTPGSFAAELIGTEVSIQGIYLEYGLQGWYQNIIEPKQQVDAFVSCQGFDAFIPVPAGPVEERLPPGLVPLLDGSGMAIVSFVMVHCDALALAGTAAPAMDYAVAVAMLSDGSGFDLFEVTDSKAWSKAMKELGVKSPVAPVDVAVATGPQAVVAGNVDLGEDSFKASATGTSIGTNFTIDVIHLVDGKFGRVGSLHEGQVNETGPVVVTVDAAPESELAKILGATSVTAAGVYLDYDAFIEYRLV